MGKLRYWTKVLMLLFCVSALFAPGQAFSAEEIKEVALDFDDVDVRLFIRVMSELTGRNFIIDNIQITRLRKNANIWDMPC
jgi:type II secretory pathway component GspD/PulD (secretin)